MFGIYRYQLGKEVLTMGLTLAEKILKAHVVDGEFVKGKEIGIRIDQTLTQDATGTMAYIEYEAMGIPSLISTTTLSSQALKMPTTTALSALSQRSTASISPVRATVSAIRYTLNVSVSPARHLSVRTAILRRAADLV